jgi:hypothetical protein
LFSLDLMHSSSRTISAGYTLLAKVFAVLWIAGFGAGTLAMFVLGSTGTTTRAFQFLLLWLLGSAFLLWSVGPLKKVSIAGHALRVSNYLRAAFIPMHQISGVSDMSLLPNLQVIVVHFRSASRFGEKIIFAPCSRAAVQALREAVTEHSAARDEV